MGHHAFRGVGRFHARPDRPVTHPGSPSGSPVPGLLAALQARPEDCLGCPDYQPLAGGRNCSIAQVAGGAPEAPHGRCTHPQRGCSRCESRIDPWNWQKACPRKVSAG